MPCVPPPSVFTDVEDEATDVPERKCRGMREESMAAADTCPAGRAHRRRRCAHKKGGPSKGPPEIRRQDGRSGLGGGLDAGMILEELLVHVGELLPLIRDLVLGEDRLHRTHRLAGATVDALIRVD